MTPEDAAVFVASLRSTFDSMAGLPMPVIAAVEVRETIFGRLGKLVDVDDAGSEKNTFLFLVSVLLIKCQDLE